MTQPTMQIRQAATNPSLSLRWLFVAVAAAASVVLLLRAAVGPFHLWGLRVASPLAAESVFGFLAVLLFFACGGRGRPLPKDTELTPRSFVLPIAIALLVVLVFLPDLRNPFLSDDYILVSRASPHALAGVGRLFASGGGDGGFRPLGDAWFDLAAFWAGWIPLRWHLLSLALHLMNCFLLFALSWSLWRNSFISCASMILFGVYASHPEAVTWTAGSFDLLACLFLLLALLCLFAPGHFSWRAILAADFLFLLGVLCKESAYALPFLVAAFAVASARERDRMMRVGFVSTSILALVLFAYRWELFHGPGGYPDPVTGRPIVLSLHLLPTAKALLGRIWAQLIFPLNWQAGAHALLFPSVLLLCGGFLVLALQQGLHRRVAAALVLATAGAILPAIHLSLLDASGLGSRVYYLASLVFCILLASLLDSIRPRSKILAVVALIVLCAGLATSLLHNLTAWRDVAYLADRACAAAVSGRGPAKEPVRSTVQGVFFFANGFPQCVSMKRRQDSLLSSSLQSPHPPER